METLGHFLTLNTTYLVARILKTKAANLSQIFKKANKFLI